MPKHVQIPFDLFIRLVRYHYLRDEDEQLPIEIEKGLSDKLESMVRHDLYSVYSNPKLSDKERETARQQYLDRIGLRNSFRWSGLKKPEPPH